MQAAIDFPLAARVVAALDLSQRKETLKFPLPSLYDAQRRIKAEARRFNVLDIGRRAGKTYLGTHLALEYAGKGHPVGWFAPNYKYLLEVWQSLAFELREFATKINATERRIELINGGVIECWTLDGTDDPGRSRKYKLAIIDEAAIASNLKAAWEEAIRATLTDLIGDAWFLSTPQGLNFFYDLFKRGQDSEAFPDWKSWQMPSSVNPFLPPTEIEAARNDLPMAVFKQEYLAEFIQSDGAVFRNVDACLTAPMTTASAHKDHYLVAGVDWGRSHDFTAISVVCCHCRAEVLLDRFNQIGWDFQRQRLLSIIEGWGVTHTIAESNAIGSPNIEALRQIMGLNQQLQGFEMTFKSKAPLIQSIALCFERATLRWLPDPVGRHELIAYEAKITEAGFTKYGSPEGGWDDTVIARALAWRAARHKVPYPLTEGEREELRLGPVYNVENAPPYDDPRRDGWETMRDWKLGQIREKEAERNPVHDDPWRPVSPFTDVADGYWRE